MLKKILIIAPLTLLFLFLGWQYSLESTRKHEEFLLTQSLFPEITEYTQKNKIPVQPIEIKLKNKTFTLYIETQDPTNTQPVQTFIAEWLKSNLKFHEYDFKVEVVQPSGGGR